MLEPNEWTMIAASSPPRRNILVATAERMAFSPANYWVALVSDAAAALGFLVLGVWHLSGSAALAGVSILVGWFVWGFLEYALHRWVLHGRFPAARRGHARHHADRTALISTPALVVMGTAAATWVLLSMILPTDAAYLVVFGLYAGYNYYALLHHLQHRCDRPLGWLARLERAHRLHHVWPTVNYGVTTMFWDRVFDTFQPLTESALANGLMAPSRGRSRRT
jgi:sterol desaturase/sphingolipid hydroxylase (fatty acid hydroxylase superfamily)